MAIKNIIFDLGGVWLPIDERRTLAAFAALAGSPAAEAAGAQGDKPSAAVEPALGSEAHVDGGMAGRGETAWSPQTGADPVAGATDKGKGDKPAAEAALGIKRPTRCKAALRERSVRGGETAWSPQTGADLIARLQPDILTYELGEIDDRTLLGRLGRALRCAPDTPPASDRALTDAWNAMLLPFPEAHLPLLDAFAAGYRIFLLSNTNALHIRCVEQDFQRRFPGRKPFLQHFEKAYLSHELHLRKPQPEIYTYVLQDAELNANETLFVDDRAENIAAAAALGLHTRLHPANTPLTELPL